MQIDVTGKRNITLDFNAPRKFRLTQNGAEIPYIRTGKNSFRLSKDVDGSVELEEINEPIRLMQPVALQPQQMAVINTQDVDRLNEAVKQMALVNPADVLMINNAAEQLERTQNFIAEEQNKLEQSQIYLDSQQQKLNESAVNIQALETNNAERLDNAEVSIYNIAEDLDTVKTATLDNINSIDSLKAENLITQATLETKADKVDVDKIKEELEEYKDDNESFKNALSNYSGGLAVEYSVSEGGKDGQILTKITDETGVYGWKDPTPVIVKSKVIPTATEKLKGEVYQYVGETGDYIHGYIYECQKIGNTYQWIRLDVQPNDSEWGKIRGNISDQTDLQTALNGKQDKLSTTQMEAVNSGANTTNIGQITTNQNNITSINDKIPVQASSSNQLADKDFVNSSIATNTANFIGTFNSVAELEAYSGTVTNNDYAFVVGTDSAGNTVYDRYKYTDATTPPSWQFEYELNNSSFTASQWQAINSGITSGLVDEFKAKGASLGYASDILSLKDSDGNVLSSVTIQASAQVDNKSITKNASDQLQTIGVINQNDTTTALKTWSGTKAEYDAIVTKDANTLYEVEGYGVFIGTTQIATNSIGLRVGDIGQSAFGIDETLNERRYLNGQVISQTQFVQFTAFLKSRVSVYPSLATTEVNWQATVTNSDLGQCGQFVIDDVAGTIRLPKVVNINGLQDLSYLGDIKSESLPNIKGDATYQANYNKAPTGPFVNSADTRANTLAAQSYITAYSLEFDASRSSSTYQDDAPVQQEAVQYPYFIQVAEGIENSVDVSREIELNNPFSLLDYKYSEYELSNASWLLSNGQWNSGAIYQSVYNLLLQIYNGTVTKAGVSVKLSTETYADTDFVLNTSDTTFRLPLKVALASGKAVAGNGMTLGLTNGTNTFGLRNGGTNGAMWLDTDRVGYPVGSSAGSGTPSNSLTLGITTDETKSGIETSANGLYLYFYVGETVQDANIIAAASVLTRIAELSDSNIAGMAMPSSRHETVTLGASGATYIAPANGYFNFRGMGTATGQYVYIGDTGFNGVAFQRSTVGNGDWVVFTIPVLKGETILINYNTGSSNALYFIYAEGDK